MFVRLILAGGTNAGMVAEIKQGFYLVGRHQECQIRPESPSVSERHCLLQHHGEFFRVRDLDSGSPTYVNHKPIKSKTWVLLNHGDMLQVGRVSFLVAITAQHPSTVVGAPSRTPGQVRQPPAKKPKAASAEDDFAERDTAEIELDQDQSPPPSESRSTVRWKEPEGTPRQQESNE